jgi:hypothetical protein
MPSNEGHIHWGGAADENDIQYLGQTLQIIFGPLEEIDTLQIRKAGSQGSFLALPNSIASSPTWETVPGTSPTLEARQDGHYPSDYIRIRQA